MCGIFGFYSKKNIFTENFYKHIITRGPDEQRFVKDKNFSFGATRLSIRDIKNGSQPFFFKEYKLYVTLNGEIYNYKYLRSLLEAKGHKFKSYCDTELIGPGYFFYGDKFFEIINGMYAISVFDQLKNEFIIIRDKFGIKPVYYFQDKDEFYFSSSAKSIYNLDFFEKEINKDSLRSILKNRYIKGNAHIFKKIFLVQPGEILRFSPTTGVKKKIFELELEKIDNENYNSKIEEFFKSRIHNYKISDVELCLLISSGIDSNLLLNSLDDKKLKLFNISFINSKYDETKKLKKLLTDSQKQNLKVLEFKNSDFELSIDKAINSFDSPICDSVIFPMSTLFETIGKKYKVTISGEGADEIFGGYYFLKFVNYFNILKRLHLIKIVKIIINFFPSKILNFFINYQGKFGPIFKTRLLNFLNREKFNLYDFNNFISVFSDSDLKKILKNDNEESVFLDQEKNLEFNTLNIINDLNNNWLPNYNCYKIDQLSMNSSLEARVPFLDNLFFSVLNFMKKNIKNYNGKKILISILRKNFNKKIKKKITFQNYLSTERKKEVLSYADNNINKDFKVFELINYEQYLEIKNKFKRTNELINEKQFFSIFILALWIEKNL